MKKRKQSTDSKKRKKIESTKRQDAEKVLEIRSKKFRMLDDHNINILKKQPINVIERVITSHRLTRTLPAHIDNSFPGLKNFDWRKPPGEFTESFDIEAKWTLARLASHADRLNSLLSLRRSFARSLLLNQLDMAAHILERCEHLFGTSSWLLESELLLAEYRGGFECNRATLSQILERPLPHNEHLLAEFASQRVDSDLSPLHYMRGIASFVDNPAYSERNENLPFYLRFSLIPQIGSTGELPSNGAAFYLYSFSGRPLVDAYAAYVKLIRHAVHMGQIEMLSRPGGEDQLSRIDEPELDTLLAVAFNKSRPTKAHSLFEARRHFNAGELSKVIDISARNLPDDPLTFDWYELLASACALTSTPLPSCLPLNSKAQVLLDAVRSFFNWDDSFPIALMTLQKLAIALESTPLGYQLTGFCFRTLAHQSLQRHLSEASRRAHLSPCSVPFLQKTLKLASFRHISLRHDPTELKIANGIDEMLHGRHSFSIVEGLHNCQELTLTADVHLWSGQTGKALELYLEQLNKYASVPFACAEALRGAFDCYSKMQQFNAAANLVATANIAPRAIIHFIDIESVVKEYRPNNSAIDKTLIAWPVLVFLNFTLSKSSREDVFEAYANFMETTDCKRPSEIGKLGVAKYGEGSFRFFLYFVCHTSVLDSDIEFVGTTDVEAERVRILQLLQDIDPAMTLVYAEEISQLQQDLAVRNALRRVATSKIHFNLDGIESSLDPSFFQRLDRYFALTRLSEGTRRTVELHWEDKTSAQEMIAEAPLLLFRELFHQVRYAFLYSNEHGLDSYLSVRIRHQTIKGALRSIFERHNLVSEKENGVYAEIGFWDEEICNLKVCDRAAINTAFAAFSSEVDEIIAVVSNEWMRICGSPGGEKGLFVMDFLDEELIAFERQLKDVTSANAFMDFLFAKLSERLTLCLSAIRHRLETDLHRSFQDSIHQLQLTLDTVQASIPASIPASITLCATELQQGIREVCEWFQLQDAAQLEDFSVRTLVAASVENITKCFPSSIFRCNIDCPSDIRLRGKCFTPLWYALFQIFENVVRHAGDQSNNTTIAVGLVNEMLVFTITNPLGTNQDEDVVNGRLRTIRAYTPEMIRREGGSGFPKLRNLIRNELGLNDDGVEFSVSRGFFTTRVELRTESISA